MVIIELKKNLIKYLYLYIGLTLISIQLFSIKEDTWDGSIISIGVSSNNLRFVKEWLTTESSMHYQYFSIVIVSKLANFIGIEFLLLSKLITITALGLIAREIHIMASDRFEIHQKWINVGILLFLLFPTNILLVSSVLHYYIWTLALTWTSSRKYFFSNTYLKNALYIMLILISTSYASMYVLTVALFLIWMTKKDFNVNTIAVIKKMIFLIILLIINYFVDKFLFPTHHIYERYNKIVFPDSKLELLQFLHNLKSFFTFAIILIIPIVSLFPVSHRFLHFSFQKPLFKFDYYNEFILVIILLLSSIIPYVLVNKSTSFFWLNFFSGRHAIPLSASLGFTIAFMGNFFEKKLQGNLTRNLYLLLCTSLLIILIFPQTSKNYRERFNFFRAMEKINGVISESKVSIPDGIVGVKISNTNISLLNYFDSALLMYRITNNLRHFTWISSKNESINSNNLSIITNQMIYPWQKPNKLCETNLFLSATNNVFLRDIEDLNLPNVKLILINKKTKCFT